MQSDTPSAPVSKWMYWVGWIISILPALMLLMSAAMKFIQPPDIREPMANFGWGMDLMIGLGIVELACTALYLIPRTAVLGAILLTGYLGGAIATHVRIYDNFTIPALLGVLVWAGLWLRDERVRKLIPFQAQ